MGFEKVRYGARVVVVTARRLKAAGLQRTPHVPSRTLHRQLQFMTQRAKRTNYELSRSQVDTPDDVVALTWQLVGDYRHQVARVLDLGAGDCRFALTGTYRTYDGVEIDKHRTKHLDIPRKARVHVGCAFRFDQNEYDLCIGNPPYVRHHDLEEKWRDKTSAYLSKEMGVTLNRKANLYVYFLALALLKTRSDGLIAQVVPVEWTIRPSASGLRKFIKKNKWSVTIYRFNEDIFPTVTTSASIAIIDKRNCTGKWRHFDITRDDTTGKYSTIQAKQTRIVPYEQRGIIWALRGMSPGTQTVFTLTEGERIHAGLRREDVMPCVTTMRRVDHRCLVLDEKSFKRHYIETGEKCWLIKSHASSISDRLRGYLKGIPKSQRDTWTCNTRRPWHRYILHPVPGLLISAGLSTTGPKVMINQIGAHAVGAVSGVHTNHAKISMTDVGAFISSINFNKTVLSHSGMLRKIEIRQINAVLNDYLQARGL